MAWHGRVVKIGSHASSFDETASMVPIVREPGDVIVIVGGGAGGKSMFLPTAGGRSLAVSRVIETD